MKIQRIAVAALSLPFAYWVSQVAVPEGWMGTAAVPTKNDRCTNGFGSTFKEDGTEVECGETIDPVKAVQRSLVHIQKDESGLKKCITGAMSVEEFGILFGFGYQYGVPATCRSSMVRHINAGEYLQACEAYLDYKYLTTDRPTAGWKAFQWNPDGTPKRWRFDCSTPGNKVCSGVWKRNLQRRTDCLEAQ